MVYITRDGNVTDGSRPLSWRTVVEGFESFVNMIYLFFETLVNPGNERSRRQAVDFRNSSGRTGGSGAPRGGNIRGLRNSSDIPPPAFCGSCSGGSCG